MLFSDEECFFDESDTETHSSGHPPTPTVIMNPEVWMDYYSQDLLNLWYSLKEHSDSQGFAILDKCTFNDFAHFCFQFSSGYPPPS